jgi:hypothetical protein
MFATTLTAWRLSRMDIHHRSSLSAASAAAVRDTHAASGVAWVDRVHQRPRRAQALRRQPVR